MRHEIRRLSPHQNAKVVAILCAIMSLVIAAPLMFLGIFMGPMMVGADRPPAFPAVAIVIIPLIYLVVGYIVTAIACAVYNFVCQFTGGIRFDADEIAEIRAETHREDLPPAG